MERPVKSACYFRTLPSFIDVQAVEQAPARAGPRRRPGVIKRCHSDLRSEERSIGGVRDAIATVDHSDIRGSTPHNRDPSGAASD